MNNIAKALLTAIGFSMPFTATAKGWEFEFTPYLWLAANEGSTGAYTTGPLGNEISSISEVDINIQDLLDHLDGGAMFNFAAKKGNWLTYAEFTYLTVSDEQSATTGPIGGSSVDVELGIDGTILDVAVGYRVVQSNGFDLYPYVGFRYIDLESDLKLDGSNGIIAIDTTLGDDWVDPVVGVHAAWEINDTFAFQGRIELGGFQDQPEEHYTVTATLNHKLSDNWSLKYFYRYLKVDYADNGFIYDMEVTGPGMGATYNF
ncbi:hypothetical protein RI845_11445 [Thalassotalea nanhaiensis]|uniref:Outer membrane protein beta-barrel domain-containing protein n=1 Tax=Thalassotalea nanhaiensis TaxID=3065648 RepID=A0ABY9TEA4_9GAMM|nr:hypothetical protein RI845_11445 [Colwelliaceae bacterium SQ345]